MSIFKNWTILEGVIEKIGIGILFYLETKSKIWLLLCNIGFWTCFILEIALVIFNFWFIETWNPFKFLAAF